MTESRSQHGAVISKNEKQPRTNDKRQTALTMPRVFHNAPTEVICQRCLQQPRPVMLVITPRPFSNFIARNGELRTARNAHFIWHIHARKQLLESRLEIFAGVDVVAVGIGQRVDFRGTS